MSLIRMKKASIILICILGSVYTSADSISVAENSFCPLICDYKVTGKKGILVDIVIAALEKKDTKIVFRPTPFRRSIEMMRTGEVTIMPGIYKSDAPDLLFSEHAIALTNNTFYVRERNDWAFKGVSSLENIKLGVGHGYTFEHKQLDNYLFANRGKAWVQTSQGSNYTSKLIKKLLIGRIDSLLDAEMYIDYSIHQMKADYPQLSENNIRKSGTLNQVCLFTAFSPKDPNSPSYIRQLDNALAKYKRTGQYAEFFKPYGVTPVEPNPKLKAKWENRNKTIKIAESSRS